MNSKMRHTVHLLLGEELSLMAPLVKQYALMYGEGDAPSYLQIISCRPEGEEGELTLMSHIQEKPQQERTFTSGLENRYRIGVDFKEKVKSEADLKQYFTALFNRSVTIEDPGADGSMNVCLYLPLYDESLWQSAQRIVKAIQSTGRRMRVDVLGLPTEMSLLLCRDEEKRKALPDTFTDLKKVTATICRAVIADEAIHRLLVFEDCNSEGLALNLDREGLIRICGEFALLYVERYEVLFPATQMGEKIDVTSFGLSMLAFDKIYFVHYLLRKSYLHILGRERVDEREKVNVNLAAQVAQERLEPHVNLYQQFVNEEVEPLIAQRYGNPGFNLSDTHQLESSLQQRIDLAIEDIQKFIADPSFSLPEKQAIMAQILGEDDSLLDGVQYYKEQLSLDDCDAETLNQLIEEDNKQVYPLSKPASDPLPEGDEIPSEKEDEEDEDKMHHGVLTSPVDENEKVYLPLKEMKILRSNIRQRTAFIRKKNDELESINVQVADGSSITQHMTDEGFQFGGEVFKLISSDSETKLFQEYYTPKDNKKKSVDLREGFTRIKSQGKLGACSAFAIISILEYIIKKSDPSNPDLSERFAYYNAVKANTKDGKELKDNGSTFYDIVETLSKDGVSTENLCPYTAKLDKPSEEAYNDAKTRLVKVAKNVRINHRSITSALSEGYPVAISLRIFDSFGADGNGFIYRPTKEDLATSVAGYHAMVICGYSEEEKVYIVRNSWGSSFGDRGYCYIPFSYVESTEYCNQACIITDIEVGQGIEVIGHEKGKVVSFHLTDDNIRASILRILIDEEQEDLKKDKQKYAQLRYSYEQLLQTLSNPTKRDEIYENSVNLLTKQIAEEKIKYKTFVEETRPAELKAFRKVTFRYMLNTLGALLACLIALGNFWWFAINPAILITSIMSGISLIICILTLWYRKYQESMLKKRLEEQAAQLRSNIEFMEKELNEKHLRMHLAGKVVSSMTDTKIRMVNKYHALVSYIHGLSEWMHDEQKSLADMVVPNRTPCIQMLNNEILDRYFEEHKEDITGGIHLYDLIGTHGLTEEDILTFKLQLRDHLITILEKEYENFSMVEYLTGKAQYPYLPASMDIAKLMPQMDRHSDCFLHILQTGVTASDTLEKTVFIHADKQADRNGWRELYRRYFSQQPGDGELDSRYKLIELQVQSLDIEQVALLYTDELYF